MNTNLEVGFFILVGLAIVIGAWWSFSTEKRLKRFFLGKKAKDLEDTIQILQKEIARLDSDKQKIEKDINVLYSKTRKSIRGISTIRFNPFPDQGSNQSFAIGMLDEDGDGVVMSSLYARDRMSVFAKPVKGGKSEYELSTEEREALEKAKI
jgi:hypothetical protein